MGLRDRRISRGGGLRFVAGGSLAGLVRSDHEKADPPPRRAEQPPSRAVRALNVVQLLALEATQYISSSYKTGTAGVVTSDAALAASRAL